MTKYIHQRRVLIVASDLRTRTSLIDDFEQLQVICDVASTGDQANELLRAFDYPLVMVALTGLSALPIVADIKQRRGADGVTIIVCLDDLTDAAASVALQAGASGVAALPFLWCVWRRRIKALIFADQNAITGSA